MCIFTRQIDCFFVIFDIDAASQGISFKNRREMGSVQNLCVPCYARAMKMNKLLAIGGVYVDINCLDFPFGKDGLPVEKEIVSVGSGYEFVAGGSAVNFTRLCSKLGLPSIIVGKIGSDRTGKLLGELILEAGIEPALITSPSVSTNVGINLVNPVGATIIASVGNANQSLGPDEVISQASRVIENVAYLYLGSCMKLKSLLPAYALLVRQARKAGAKIVVDHGRTTNATTSSDLEMIRSLVASADYYFPSADEFGQLWGTPSIEEGLTSRAWGTTCVAVKDGANGVVGLVGGRAVRIKAHPVKPVNTVGAGDAFNAGVIAGLDRGNSWLESLHLGCATAALKISKDDLPSWADVAALAAGAAR
jgi:sugar/nucleoside kinase (ribokinase family)